MTEKLERNRKCPKCGSAVVGVLFSDYRPHIESPYTEMGGSCVNEECNWEIQFRSSNC